GERLSAAGEVNDREPPRTQRHPGFDVHLLVVGAAMGDRAGHRQESLDGKLSRAGQIQRTSDSAHGRATPRGVEAA
ncbi:MAG: hypothetical protein JO355_16415, partial [Planctomycetaceae bacterium]|nr:hypothetical protein [Planctomycetaceae bacterium]